ncbi:MAG: hypothetical protein IJX63_12045 [Lachnospiraceae bacterium]|nr:hypothetical protein [Lachnospiraceae bacterium]
MKYVVSVSIILLLIIDILIFLNLKKYVRIHENELVEKHRGAILGRMIAMLILAGCVGILGIVLQLI